MALVNGPVNTVRLEGMIGSNKKVVYVFMDFHAPPTSQKKCDDIRAVDVNTFFVEEFDKLYEKNSNIVLDFLFERGQLRPYHEKNAKGMYIDEISDMFTKSLKINIDTNKVQKSDLVPNVRFHHTDVRDFLTRNNFKTYYGIISPILNNIYSNSSYGIQLLTQLFNGIHIMQSEFSNLYISFYQNRTLKNPLINKSLYSENIDTFQTISELDIYKLAQKTIYKLRNSYKNDSIKKIINEIIDTELHDMFLDSLNYFDNILLFITEEINFLSKFKNYGTNNILLQQSNLTYTYGIDQTEYLKKILKFNDIDRIIFDKYIYIGAYLMDLYKLRRILDKEYVTNAISYAGGGHSCNYIRILIKYFNFNITHYSYLKNDNITEAEKIIKKTNKEEELYVLFFSPIFTQCSNLSSFPKLFS